MTSSQILSFSNRRVDARYELDVSGPYNAPLLVSKKQLGFSVAARTLAMASFS